MQNSKSSSTEYLHTDKENMKGDYKAYNYNTKKPILNSA
jgi:hypothetical protein